MPAKAACQPTNHLQMYIIPYGSWPAGEGGLPADQFLADVHRSTVGVSLLAIAVCQPTIFSLLPPIDRSLRSAWECRPGRSAFHFCVLKDV